MSFISFAVALQTLFSFLFLDFVAIPAIFYVVVAALGINISILRRDGWVFDMGASSQPWYTFYSYFSEHFNELLHIIISRLRIFQISDSLVSERYGKHYLRNLHCELSSIISFAFNICTFYLSLFFNVLHPPLNVPALGKSPLI